MSELGEILASLGLEQYHDALISEGFDTWETVQDITEHDLDVLNFKLGHRRKLQRYIASQRGINVDQPLPLPYAEGHGEKSGESNIAEIQPERSTSETKRKYRRHPKPDENAPERPPSAYVLFSNAIREEIKGQDLSFTEIAKLVGQRWQALRVAQREPFETRAATLKETFNQQLAEYKKSEQYKDYLQYLAEFRAKYGGGAVEGKRPKLEEEISVGSVSSPGFQTPLVNKSPDLPDAIHGLSETQGRPVPAMAQVLPGQQPLRQSVPMLGRESSTGSTEGRGYATTPHLESIQAHTGRKRDSDAASHPSPGDPGGYFDPHAKHARASRTSSHIGAPQSGPSESRQWSKPTLSHQDTTVSNVSSVPSTMTYGSASSALTQTPLTPRDEGWTPRATGYEPLSSKSSSWETTRPILPPFQSPHGLPLGGIHSLAMPDRGLPYPRERGILPPLGPSSSSGSHDIHPQSSRSQALPPPSFADHARSARSHDDQGQAQSTPEGRGEASGGSPLDLLARAVDAQHRDKRGQ